MNCTQFETIVAIQGAKNQNIFPENGIFLHIVSNITNILLAYFE